MRRIFLSMLLAGSLAGVVRAQQTTGAKAEAVRREVTKIELEKVAGMHRSMAEHADWLNKQDADDLVRIGTVETNDELRAQQSGEYKVLTMKQDGHQVFVYANGNTAAVTYRLIGTVELKGKVFDLRHRLTDVWVRQNGGWKRIFQLIMPLE